jgi:hypothetical protein
MPASLQTSIGAPELVPLLDANPLALAVPAEFPPLLVVVFPPLLLLSPPELDAVPLLNGEPELPPAAQATTGERRAITKPQGRRRAVREVGATPFVVAGARAHGAQNWRSAVSGPPQ